MGIGLVERRHLAEWCRSIQARSKFPELISRLIGETTERADGVVFPSDEGVDAEGYDGSVMDSSGSVWVPQGPSVWELSINAKPGTKADTDYCKRTSDPRGWDRASTTYVQVSLRPWDRRGVWAADRCTSGLWRAVRAIGLDDIVAWLGDAPRTELWLAELLGLHPAELSSGPVWWGELLDRTGGLYDQTLILAGRETEARDLRTALGGSASPVVVEAESVDEAVEFIAASALVPTSEDETQTLLERMVFVRGPGAWRRLHDEPGPRMLLVACDPALAELPGSERHASVIAVQRHCGTHIASRERDGSRDAIMVPRLDRRRIAEALDTDAARARGIDFQRAQRLANEAHLSTAVLRRALMVDPAVRVPDWATNPDADAGQVRAKTAALLAGEWFADSLEASSPEMEALAELAGGGLDYEALVPHLSLLASDPDPMLDESGDEWRLVSAPEAWLLLADSLLNARVLNRFAQVAPRVLSESDPLADMAFAERVTAQMQGTSRAYSMHLRRGVARTLALMATFGLNIPAGHGSDAASLAQGITRQVLRGEHLSAVGALARLDLLADVLPLLAEAAPDAFLEVLDTAMSGPDAETASVLFDSDESPVDAIFDTSLHTSVLWAIERIAWLPDQLADIASVLMRLVELDPGGRTANRPINTFGGIFSAWAPQTSAASGARLEVLRGLHSRVLSTAARPGNLSALAGVLIATLPRPGAWVHATTRPEVRTCDTPTDGPALPEIDEYVEAIATLLNSVTAARIRDHADPNGLLDVIEADAGSTTATILPQSARQQLWTLFEQAPQFLDEEALREIARRLADLSRLHQTYLDAQWALTEDEAKRVSDIAESMNAQDLISANAWLFEQYDPPLGEGPDPRDDFDAYGQLVEQRRCAAVSEVLHALGIDGVRDLAVSAAENPQAPSARTIGEALARAVAMGEPDNTDESLSADEIEADLLGSLDISEVGSPSEAARAALDQDISAGYFAGRFRRSEASGDDAWAWLDRFMRSSELTARQKARLIEITRDHPRAWQQAALLGPDVEAEYWSVMNYCGMGSDFSSVEDVAVGLLSVNRFADAAHLLTMYQRAESLTPQRRAELAIHALQGVELDGAAEMHAAGLANTAQQLLDFLAETFPPSAQNLDDQIQQRLYGLQVKFLGVRDLSKPIPFVHQRIALDPRAFVELVSLVLRPDSAPVTDTDPTAELPEEERQRERNKHRAAVRILESWRQPPAADGTGQVDTERLKNWVDQAQELLETADRREFGDHYIGRALAAASPDPDDGIAPPRPIRELLEIGQSDKLISGLVSGIVLGRPEMRGGLVTEVARLHRDAASRARKNAKQIAATTPKAARLLRRAADSHDAIAGSWEAEEDRLD